MIVKFTNILLTKPIHYFKYSYQRPYLSLTNLKQTVERQYFYVRKNKEQIGYQIMDSIKNHQWNYTKNLLKIIRINQLDSWLILRKIAIAINITCNNIKIQYMKQQQIIDMLSVLVLLRFQPKSFHKKYHLSKISMQYYDDSTSFINELQIYISNLSIEKQFNFIIELSRKLLHTHPQMFLPQRKQFQMKILNKLQNLIQSRSLLNDVLVKGCISNFWTPQFKQELLKQNLPQSYLKSLRFSDISIPNKIQKLQNTNIPKTQIQIHNILQGYGYSIQQNLLINGYQIDFLIGNKFIIEYNGHHHFIINSIKQISTNKDKWKYQILKKRGFVISTIPYTQWKYIKLFQDKRKYLVTKIENDWIKQYKEGLQKKNQ